MGEHLTQARNPLLVEFVGLPGAGKTTVSQQVVSKLSDRGLPLISRSEILKQWHQENTSQKLFKLFPYNLNDLSVLFHSFLLATQVKPINLQSFIQAGKVFSNVKRNDTVVRAGDRQIILLDQGLLQEIWSVALTGTVPPMACLKREMTSLFHKRSMVFVYFKVDIDTAVSRIKTRATMNSCFDRMDSRRAYLSLLEYHPYLQEIIDYAKTLGMTVLEIDGKLSLEEKSEKIATWIATQMN
jgi:adenylate kinase family enzyme